MFGVLVFVSLQAFLHRFPAVDSAAGRGDSTWFVGCFNATSSGLRAPRGARDLDPATCSARCLDEGFRFAALTSQACYCGNGRRGLVSGECSNTSPGRGTEGVRGQTERQSVVSGPVGRGRGHVALYRTEGPFLHSVRVSVSTHRLQAGAALAVEVSGKLAGRPDQPTGIPGVAGLNFSYVAVEIQETTRKGQSSHRAGVLDDGSFAVTSDWVLESLGRFELNVSVSNPVSSLSSSLSLSPHSGRPAGDISWCFTQKDGGTNGETVCLPVCSANWTFETERVHKVSVNASAANGWTRETICVAALHPGRVSGSGQTSGQSVPEDVELFTAMRRLFLLNLTLSAAAEGRSPINTTDCHGGALLHIANRSYEVTVKAFKLNRWASFCTHILIRVPVGEPVLKVRLHQVVVSVAAAAASNVSVSLLLNTAPLCSGSSSTAGGERTAVLSLDHTGTAAVELRAENRVSSQNKSVSASVENRKLSPQVNPTWRPRDSESPAVLSLAEDVRIHTAKRAYPTNADVTFLAVTEASDPVEFLWHFGDSKSARTTSRSVTRRYRKPGRYDVVVVMSRGRTSVTSDVSSLVVQRAVRLNRLLHQASVLLNQTVAASCRVSAGTDVSFLWSFGDGSSRTGRSTEEHVFHRTGEFTVTVTVSNLVSSASLSSHIFVVDRPCQPPPVKNMGPLKLQVRRHEVIRLAVTYETEVDCDISGGLRYTWTLLDSAGRVVPVPLVDTHKQSLMLPGDLLSYDTYAAVAKVQVVGSSVYSSYSVRVQVVPRPPVAFIQGGTNVFINSSRLVTLDGKRSYDPDFPTNPLSFRWTCEPVSSVSSSCFHQELPTSASPVLVFPASFLKHDFDQFRFTLTVHSGERWASSDAFVTLRSDVTGQVSVTCPQCRGRQLNWDQSVSVSAACEGCGVGPEHIRYSWRLFSVDASPKPNTEVPFCYAADLSAPSAILDSTSTLTPPRLPPPDSDPDSSKTRAKKRAVRDSGIFPRNNRESLDVTGEDPFYRPPEEFEPLSSSAEYRPPALDNSGVLHSELFGQSDVISDPVSSADWDFSLPVSERGDTTGRPDLDYDVPLMSAEEGDPGVSAGRPTGVEEGEAVGSGDESAFDPALHEDVGSNLVDSRPSVLIRQPSLLDLSREPVDRREFESYTFTGVSSPVLSFRPFSLKPGSSYMLEVTAESRESSVGRTQLFLKTNPAPEGVMCQVQPAKGAELYTHFSIFCSSGKEDLTYEHSVRIGDRPARLMYQGRDFLYYFSLPSGDPSDDYKVTISTQIRSSRFGTATKPCPVTVRVRPSFLRHSSSSSSSSLPDPDLELSRSGLRNLSSLVLLGNNVEIRNHVSLLSAILNRLSLQAEANVNALRCTRSALVCTLCELRSREQASMMDNIHILKNLLQVTSQVTPASARRVTRHVQLVSEQFSDSGAAVPFRLDQETLSTLVSLLSCSLRAAAASQDFTAETSSSCEVKEAESSCGGGSIPAKQAEQLVSDALQTASDLMLRYVLLQKTEEHRLSDGLVALHAARLNQTSVVIRSGSVAVSLPASLLRRLFVHGSRDTCVLSVLTELTHSPNTSAPHAGRLRGPVVDLSLYECSARRKLAVRSLVEPINMQLQQEQPPANESSEPEYVLRRRQVNYHSFNITQEHLQQPIQLSVVFKPPLNKGFPVLLLFRMFERPTPSMHHLYRTHHWASSSTRFTLPSSYLSAAGIGHLALLNADFDKARRNKHLSEEVGYSVTAHSSLCLSWDGHQGAWTRRGCRTQQADASINCSCHQLRPLAVAQQPIQSRHDTAGLEPFLSVSSDLTVLGLLLLCVFLYIPSAAACKKADDVAEESRRVHYLPDNCPADQYLYAVTTHTGASSAARMSAKVYIVLKGEDGASQARELHVPGCTLFRRNSKDTFIFSAADSLGSVSGVHIWHDNSGPAPSWYLKQVEVSELSRGHAGGGAWLFVGPCWLAVNKGDGRVERTLRVCRRGLGFAKMLSLKLPDYVADHHIWISVLRRPSPHSFTHTQRLSVSLLLLSGYACVNAAAVSQMDDQSLLELGVTGASSVSMATGVLSVLAVLPVAAMISWLFRLHEVKLMGSGVRRAESRKTGKDFSEDVLSVTDGAAEPHLSWINLQLWAQEASRKKHQVTDLLPAPENNDPVVLSHVTKEGSPAVEDGVGTPPQNVSLVAEGNGVGGAPRGKQSDPLSGGSGFRVTRTALLSLKEEDPRGEREEGCQRRAAWPGKSSRFHLGDGREWRGLRPGCEWGLYVGWTLSLLLSLSCLLLSAALGMRFSSSQVLLWINSLFFSLTSCIFFLQPAAILVAAVAVCCRYRNRADFHSFSRITEFESLRAAEQERCSHLQQLLGARQRARHLRLVRPPTPSELRKARRTIRREALLHKALRDVCVCGSMLLLMLCVNHSSSLSDHFHLNKAVRKQLARGDHSFMSIQTQEDWWKWAETSLLDSLYRNSSAATESHIVIGEPVLWKAEDSLHGCASDGTLVPECLPVFSAHSQANVSMEMLPKSCYLGPSDPAALVNTKSEAVSKLKLLHSGGWLSRRTVAVKVQFTLFNPAANLFTGVSMLAEQSPTGVLLPSAKVQTVRVHHTPAVWDFIVMVCQLLFLLLSLLQLCHQVHAVGQQGLMGYWKTPCNWLEAGLLAVTLAYYVYYIYHSSVVVETAELLQRHDRRGQVDVGLLATCEQNIRTLRGVALFLLTVKCATALRLNRTLAFSATLLTRSLSSLFWPMISGLVLMAALSCVGSLLFGQTSRGFSSLSCPLQTRLRPHWGPRTARGLPFSWSDFLYRGVLSLSSSALWTAVGIAVVSSLVRSAKRSRIRRDGFSVEQLAGYVRRRVRDFTGRRRRALMENQVEGKTYYFEEFEGLVDELLFRLNAVSDTLSPKAHRCREEDSPVSGQELPSVDSRDFPRTQTEEETAVSDDADVSGQTRPACHLLRSKPEPQQRGQREDSSSSHFAGESDGSQQAGRRFTENQKHRKPRSHLETVETEDVLEMEHVVQTKAKTSQANHTEVVVEVLIHKGPACPPQRAKTEP